MKTFISLCALMMLLASCGKEAADSSGSAADSAAIDRIASDKLTIYQMLVTADKKGMLAEGLALAMTDPAVAATIKAAAANPPKASSNSVSGMPRAAKKDELDKASDAVTKADSVVTKGTKVVDKSLKVMDKVGDVFKK